MEGLVMIALRFSRYFSIDTCCLVGLDGKHASFAPNRTSRRSTLAEEGGGISSSRTTSAFAVLYPLYT